MEFYKEQALKQRLQNEIVNIKSSLQNKEFRDFLVIWLKQVDELIIQSSTLSDGSLTQAESSSNPLNDNIDNLKPEIIDSQ